MALRLFPVKQSATRRPQTVTAAATVLPATRATGRAGVPAWQQQAWTFFDQIGEVRYGARYYGNSLSRLRLFVGWRDSPSDPVVPVDPADFPAGIDRRAFEAANHMVTRLHSTDGSVSELLRAFGVNMFIAGEGYIVGRTEPESGRESWEFLSVDQVVWHNERWNIRESVADQPSQYRPLNLEEDVVRRVWLPHPRFASEADSPMRAVLTVCEELLLLSASVRASALSRIPAGILLMPDTMLEGGPDTYIEGDGTDGEAQADRTLADLVDHFVRPIGDPESAAAVAPFILTGDPADVDKVRLLEPSRSVDEVAAQQRAELLVRLANGVDLPPEVLSGLSNTNHWNAWMIDEQSFKAHIAPAAQLFVNALTEQLVWPAMMAAGVPVDDRIVVGFDAAELVGHPDRKANAKDGHGSLVISDEAYRRALGFSDEDAPDEAEYVRRVALANGTQALAPVAAGELDSVVESLRVATGQVAAGEAEGVESVAGPVLEPVVEVTPGPPEEPEAVTAAAATVVLFGDVIGRLDRSLFDRIETALNASLERALERAGSRLRSRLARDATYRSVVTGVKASEVGRIVGRDGLVAAGLSDEDLVDEDEFAETAALALLLLERAHKRVRRELGRYGLDATSEALLEERQAEDRAAAGGFLIGAMTGLAVGALFGGKAAGPEGVAADVLGRVPTGVTRGVLATAGGGVSPVQVSPQGVVSVPVAPPVGDRDGQPARPGAPAGLDSTGSAAGGPTVREAAAQVGLVETGFIWDYGDEMRATFEPHFELDGREFAGPEDSGLFNSESFPAGDFYYPGDHDGCRCSTVPIYTAIAVGADDA